MVGVRIDGLSREQQRGNLPVVAHCKGLPMQSGRYLKDEPCQRHGSRVLDCKSSMDSQLRLRRRQMNIEIVGREGKPGALGIGHGHGRLGLRGLSCLLGGCRVLVPAEQDLSMRRTLVCRWWWCCLTHCDRTHGNDRRQQRQPVPYKQDFHTLQDPNPLRSFTGFCAAGGAAA